MSAFYTRREYERMQAAQAQSRSASSTGTFCSLLTVLLIGLKLTGHFPHSWWLVWSPIWGPCAVYLALALVAAIFSVAGEALQEHGARKRRVAAAAENLAQAQAPPK